MHSNHQLYLFRDKRFLPLFMIQFFGCFNDNVLKNAITIIITYKSIQFLGLPTQILVMLAYGIFILPFVVFAGLAGQVADKYEKTTLIRIIKLVEIFITLVAIYGFYEDNILILFCALMAMGVHSTFFGPLKYSVMPDHLEKDELLAANGFVEAGTFLSILLGTIFGGLYNSYYANLILGLMIASSALGFIFTIFMPKSGNYNPDIKINHNFLEENWSIIKYSYSKKQVFLSILGISWFWFIGATFLSQIPVLVKDILGADQTVVTLFLSVFSIGVCIGSVLCNRLLANEITTKYLVIACIGISLFGIDLFFSSKISAIVENTGSATLINFIDFLSKANNWRIILDLFLLSVIGGFYIVPLYAVMQYFSSPTHRSRVIAANNIINSAFMVVSTLLVSSLLYAGLSVQYVILIISLLNIVVAIYIHSFISDAQIIPEPILRRIVKFLFDKLYRVEVKNIENFYKSGRRTVIISNHISYLDAALLTVYLPERFTFAINTDVAKIWWVRPFLRMVKAHPIDSTNVMAAKTLITEIKKNKKIAIFPEGRLSVTGSLMKVYEGPGMIADKADANILPIRIDGPQFTHFSKLRRFAKTKLFPKITITILPPVKFEAPEHFDSRTRRKFIGQKLYDIMSEMIFESSDYKKCIFQSIIEAAKIYGFNNVVARDIENNHVSYRQLIARSFILGNYIAKRTDEGEYVGIMLPNTVATLITFCAMQAYSRVPTMINFTSGAANIISGCKTVGVKIIYTSKRFIAKAGLEDLAEKLAHDFRMIYLEDLRDKISLYEKLKGFIAGYFPNLYYGRIVADTDYNNPAVVLFTSGTEGKPKAVVLSHQNIQANRCQMSARIDTNSNDIAFNVLPMFHCFGLTVGTILPLLSGLQVFLYPSPLHYRIIPEVIYDIGATILFGTDTFLSGYAKFAHPYDFYSLRYVFAGAEKLKNETRKLWFEKYGIRIFEGYGVTEAAPVVACNTPMHDKPGTVGKLFPGIEYFIHPVEGIDTGGTLCIRGPNIMLGYIKADNPKVIVSPFVPKLGNGWYDTGDVVVVDSEEFINIQGRVKRFAKIGGEMVSLGMVEEIVSHFAGSHAAVHITDNVKGEQIVLFTTNKDLDKQSIIEAVKNKCVSELYIPKHIVYLEEIPLLSTGKTNYRELIVHAENNKL